MLLQSYLIVNGANGLSCRHTSNSINENGYLYAVSYLTSCASLIEVLGSVRRSFCIHFCLFFEDAES